MEASGGVGVGVEGVVIVVVEMTSVAEGRRSVVVVSIVVATSVTMVLLGAGASSVVSTIGGGESDVVGSGGGTEEIDTLDWGGVGDGRVSVGIGCEDVEISGDGEGGGGGGCWGVDSGDGKRVVYSVVVMNMVRWEEGGGCG